MKIEDLINGIAGAGCAFITQLITYPLRTVSTRQQIERNQNERRNIYQFLEQEGWERLYGGFALSLAGTATCQGLYKFFYQIFKKEAKATALAGIPLEMILSECLNVMLTNPIWLVVTRMQTHTKNSQPNRTDLPSPEDVIPSDVEPPPFGTSLAIQEVYSERGVLGFWRGALPSLIMVSNPSIQFMLYETLLKRLKTWRLSRNKGNSNVTPSEVSIPIFMLDEHLLKKLKQRLLSNDKRDCRVTTLEVFLLETLAELGATIVTYPVLVVKSRLQAEQTVADERHRYKGTMDAIEKMIRYEGWNGFYKGLSAKIVQRAFASAIPFMLKDKLVKGIDWVLLKVFYHSIEFIVIYKEIHKDDDL